LATQPGTYGATIKVESQHLHPATAHVTLVAN
jgi:hypothetical protein